MPVKWYEEDVMAIVDSAERELLTKLAFQAEAVAKADPDTPVDTGFMRNALYGLGPDGSHRGQAQGDSRAVADRDLAPEPRLDERVAALHGAALYTIYQEIKHGFMHRAVERVASLADGIIKKVGRTHFR